MDKNIEIGLPNYISGILKNIGGKGGKKVKNINLRIKPNMEVYISVPMNLHRDYIENFIRSKEGWIKSVLKKTVSRRSKPRANLIQISTMPYCKSIARTWKKEKSCK